MRKKVALLIGFIGIVSMVGFMAAGQQDWPGCTDDGGCVSKDLVVNSVFIEAGECSGGSKSGVLKADMSTNTTRYSVRVTAKIYSVSGEVETFLKLVDVCLASFAGTSAVTIDSFVVWNCEDSLVARNVLISWQSNATAYPCDCVPTLPCDQITPKCNYYASGFVVEGSEPPNTPPVVSDIPDQTIAEGSTFATINLDDYVTDVEDTDADMTWTYAGNTELTVTIDASRVATIGIPDADWNGAETITFRATDPGSLWDEDAATFTVTPVNDTPVAVDDSYSIDEDTTLNGFTVLVNDSDVDGDPLTVNTTPVDDVDHGTLTLDADGTFTYTPDPDFNGHDSFSYEVSDGNGGNDTATVAITVNPVNDPPTAVDDMAQGEQDTPFVIDVVSNDIDPDGDPLQVISATTPAHGTVEIISNKVRYTPDPSYYGSDSFSYTIEDAGAATATADVALTIIHPNIPPRADAGGAYHGFTTDPILLDARFSIDPDFRDTLEYRWDLNWDGEWDTEWLSSSKLEHTFDRPYRGLITVEVRDLYFGVPLGTTDQATTFATILPKPTQIAITVFVDLNGNGERDEGDVGLPGVSLLLDGETEFVTGEDGMALADDVEPGAHVVSFSEAGLKYLSDRGFVLDTSEKALEIESGDWIALFFSPEARGFLQVNLVPRKSLGGE